MCVRRGAAADCWTGASVAPFAVYAGVMDFDAIVVGSGFGGSVCAARLAEKGMRVLVLERGPWWGPAHDDRPAAERRPFPRGFAGWRKLLRGVRWARTGRRIERMLHADGLFEWHAFERLHVFTGSGVGGGSLIYTSIQEQPPAEWFGAFPPEIDAAVMEPHYARVHSMLRPAPVPDLPEKNRVFDAAVRAAGLPAPEYPALAVAWGPDTRTAVAVTNAAGVEQRTCTHRGECVLGCPQRAKTTLDLTYIPLALARGARLQPLCEVDWIGRAGAGWVVRWTDHRTHSRGEATAARLVLAAGTLGTLRLLFGARDRWRTLPDLPSSLGMHFSPNADMGILLWRTRAVHDSSRGTALNAVVKRATAAGSRYLVGEVGLPVAALGLPGWVRRPLERSVMLLAMGRDRADGIVTWDGTGLRTDLDRGVGAGVFDAIEVDAGKIAAHYGARRVMLNWPAGKRGRALATVHPLGGASMARSPGEGVVDHAGRVFGHAGLYVADGSLYPVAPGIPPSMTIAALAERISGLME